MVAHIFNPSAGEALACQNGTGILWGWSVAPEKQLHLQPQSYRPGFLDLATVLDPSTYLSDPLLWPQSGWPRCQLFALQCLDPWRKSNSSPTAHSLEEQTAPSQSAECDSGPRHAVRATAGWRLS